MTRHEVAILHLGAPLLALLVGSLTIHVLSLSSLTTDIAFLAGLIVMLAFPTSVALACGSMNWALLTAWVSLGTWIVLTIPAISVAAVSRVGPWIVDGPFMLLLAMCVAGWIISFGRAQRGTRQNS